MAKNTTQLNGSTINYTKTKFTDSSHSLISISGTFFIDILPIVPFSSFLLFPVINLFLVRVSVFFVCFLLFFLPLHSVHHVLVFKVSHLFQRHCWLIGILLPYLSNQVLTLVQWAGGIGALMLLTFGKLRQ